MIFPVKFHSHVLGRDQVRWDHAVYACGGVSLGGYGDMLDAFGTNNCLESADRVSSIGETRPQDLISKVIDTRTCVSKVKQNYGARDAAGRA